MDTSKIVLQTENLILKGLTLEYKEDIFKEFTKEITIYMFPKPAEKIEETIEFINSSIKKNIGGEDFQIVIIHRKNGEFLGGGGLHHLDKKNPEFGIWIKKSAQGNAYGKEAIIALKKWADENIDYEYLLYHADTKNYASKRIPEFLGGKMTREYDQANMSGKTLHLLEYRIYPTEK